MIEGIVGFSQKLRENKIPASIRSTQLAINAVNLIKNSNKINLNKNSYENDENIKNALRAIYLKDNRFKSKFDKVFDDFFINNDDNDNEKIAKSFGNVKKAKFKVYTSSSTSKRKMNNDFGRDKEKYRIDYLKNTLNDFSFTQNSNNIDTDFDSNNSLLKNDIKTINTMQVDLLDLTQKLGQKIATKRSKIKKIAKKQKPDIRRSIRQNLKNGGCLINLIKSKPKIKKHNHYFLSDVSVSCDWISIWFFCMVYTSQQSFSKTRVFEFDNKSSEITSALYEPDLVDAFIKVMKIRHQNKMIQGKSNMFTAFSNFEAISNLNSKSYLLILSDCRDWAGGKENGIPRSAEIIENFVKKSKRVLILNPEEKNKWNVADSCVSYYESVGAEIFEVRNLEQLANLIMDI
ncbi:MAG: VWA domain-containing protein [Methanobrevibacter sp.]|jgi:uncharacterized protein with von Willebrand factor type A (vWA) domain|nr:VWA domain-containing protein [Candidatus Methanoflexus mossambicus]